MTRFIVSNGGVIGHSRHIPVDRIVLVDPHAYGRLPERSRYTVARSLRPVVSRRFDEETIMLIGPGRWGTSTPSLGVPVHVSDIAGVSILMEVDIMHDGLVPDLSLGTHVFHEMVELDMLYIAHSSGTPGNLLELERLKTLRSEQPEDLPPEAAACVSCYQAQASGNRLMIHADARAQTCVLYEERG